MKKRARICLYIFLVCAFILLGIGGYFVFGKPNENVRVGRKFVTFNSVQDASCYAVSVEDKDGDISSDVIYKVDKQDASVGDAQIYEYKIDVFIDSEQVAKESYTQTILSEDTDNDTIDCVISNYTIFFLCDSSTMVYPDQTLEDVDKDIFCCVVCEYFDDLFIQDEKYTLICKSLDGEGNLIEENTYEYSYEASYKEDFIRRGEYYYDGVWYDYIIESRTELKAFVWYAILYRLGGEEGYSFYVDCKEITAGNINNLVISAINDYPEYDALEDAYVYAKLEGNIGYLVNFEYYLDSDFLLTYKDTKSLDKTSNKRYYNQALTYLHQKDDSFLQDYIVYVEEPEIEENGTEQGLDEQNNAPLATTPVARTYKIDSAENQVVVYNTEQLFMVVQSGAKPIFVDENSVVKKVYDNAIKVLEQINNSDYLTDLEKVTNIYRYITSQIIYDYVLYQYMVYVNDYSIKTFGNFSAFYLEGVFYDFDGLSDHYAVCDGLSKAFVLLCGIEGIKSIKVNGEINGNGGGNHAWNKVFLQEGNLDGWYYVDTTWGQGEYDNNQILTHTYFLFDLSSKDRKVFYPENIEKIAPTAHTDYYEIMSYTYNEESADCYIESDGELSHALSYAQSLCAQDGNGVIELKFGNSYYSNSSSNIKKLIDIQNQIEELERKIEDEKNLLYKMEYKSDLQKLKNNRDKWFKDNGVTAKYEWLKVGKDVFIFKIYI